jgi:hypothetical protein
MELIGWKYAEAKTAKGYTPASMQKKQAICNIGLVFSISSV